MAARKPLVLVSGQIQQLQSGDTLAAAVTEVDVVILLNNDVSSHLIGEVVYIDGNASSKRAKADAAGTSGAIGLATATIVNATTGTYQTSGVLAGLSALTFGAEYYVSAATAGLLTATPPSSVGQYVIRVGRAISATELMIDIERPILL